MKHKEDKDRIKYKQDNKSMIQIGDLIRWRGEEVKATEHMIYAIYSATMDYGVYKYNCLISDMKECISRPVKNIFDYIKKAYENISP